MVAGTGAMGNRQKVPAPCISAGCTPGCCLAERYSTIQRRNLLKLQQIFIKPRLPAHLPAEALYCRFMHHVAALIPSSPSSFFYSTQFQHLINKTADPAGSGTADALKKLTLTKKWKKGD